MRRSHYPVSPRSGVSYYLGNHLRRTGRTFADQDNAGNQYPFVYSRTCPTGRLDEILLAGHHQAAAALLKDEPLRARRVEGGFGPNR